MYTPNFNNKLVRDRIDQSVRFVLKYLHTSEARPCAKTQLDLYLGQQQNKLGKYLREKLLICTNQRYNKDLKICKEYIYNSQGISFLRHNININTTNVTTAYSVLPSEIIYENALIDFGEELDSKAFNYTTKEDFPRLMHGLQSVNKKSRNDLLRDKGFIYEYDIVCCAPSLILYHSYQLGTGEWMPTIDDYINNRKKHRERLANELEITKTTAKEIINAMFCGGKLSANRTFSQIYAKLQKDKAKMLFLQEDIWIQQLKKEIKQCWDHILPHYPKYIRHNNTRRLPIRPRDKWNIYFTLERQTLDHIAYYLEQEQSKSFLIHDGWHTNKSINTVDLQQYVYNNTKIPNNGGYLITIEGN